MKKVYISPKALILNIDDESALCAATTPTVGGQITGSDYEDIVTTPIGEGDVPITAKGRRRLLRRAGDREFALG